MMLLALPSSLGNGVWSHIQILGMDFLTFFDFISNSVIMPIVALLGIFTGSVDIDTGLDQIQALINTETAKKLADS